MSGTDGLSLEFIHRWELTGDQEITLPVCFLRTLHSLPKPLPALYNNYKNVVGSHLFLMLLSVAGRPKIQDVIIQCGNNNNNVNIFVSSFYILSPHSETVFHVFYICVASQE